MPPNKNTDPATIRIGNGPIAEPARFFLQLFFWDILTLGLCWKIPFKSVYHPFEKFDEVSALKFSPAKRSSAKKNIPKSVEKSIFVFEKGRETYSNWNRNCLHPKNHGISSHFKNSSAVAHWTLPYGRIWSCIAGVFLGPQNSQAIEGSKFLGLGKLCIISGQVGVELPQLPYFSSLHIYIYIPSKSNNSWTNTVWYARIPYTQLLAYLWH